MNYKEDFNFYLNYLKRNNPKLKDLNVNELIEKNENICNCNNDYEFFKKLLSFYINNFTLSQGHNQPLYPFIPKDFIAPNSYVNKYLSQMKHSNFSQIKPLTKTYLLSIINDNSIIKIPKTKLRHDNEINKIVNEETMKFFDYECSAEECADMIQNRVSLYLSERYG